jgi:hypothetical protein
MNNCLIVLDMQASLLLNETNSYTALKQSCKQRYVAIRQLNETLFTAILRKISTNAE